jgi:uncharacterized membrane protein
VPEYEQAFRLSAPREEVWKVITDFEGYTDVIRAMKESKVVAREEGSADVAFTLDLGVRRVTYTLRYAFEEPERLAWEMLESNTLEANAGEWNLEADGAETKVLYRHRAAFPAWIAWAVTDKAFAEEMDKTLARFREAVEKRS